MPQAQKGLTGHTAIYYGNGRIKEAWEMANLSEQWVLKMEKQNSKKKRTCKTSFYQSISRTENTEAKLHMKISF